MLLHTIQTTISLILFLLGFFMIGFSCSERFSHLKVPLAVIGFALITINFIYLGSVILNQTLAAGD